MRIYMRKQEARRKELKKFILSHARQFDMGVWYAGDTSPTASVAEAIARFEACGTACCIGGALDLLSGFAELEDDILLAHCGLKEEIFDVNQWPEKIRKDYVYSRAAGDYDKAAAAGCAAIDYYAGGKPPENED